MTNTELARAFHETYERLAPQFGYTTREETRDFDSASDNGRLMIAVCAEIAAAQAVQAVPGGQWVPVEPTDQMLTEFFRGYTTRKDAYRAMLAAAPQPSANATLTTNPPGDHHG